MASMTSDRLTERQLKVYRWIFNYTCEKGYQPSLRDVAKQFDMAHNAVVGHIALARRKGYVDFPKYLGSSRALRFLLCPDGTPFTGFVPKS